MKLSHTVTCVVLAAITGGVSADNSVRRPMTSNDFLNPDFINSMPIDAIGAIVNNPLKNVKYECIGTSARVSGTVVNDSNTPVTYTPVFKGNRFDQCLEYYPCTLGPGETFCLPTDCKTTQKGEAITVNGQPVLIPGSEIRDVFIDLPNTGYQSGKLGISGFADIKVRSRLNYCQVIN